MSGTDTQDITRYSPEIQLLRAMCRRLEHAGPSLCAARRPRPGRTRRGPRLLLADRLHLRGQEPRGRPRRPPDRGVRVRPRDALLEEAQAGHDGADRLARRQRQGRVLGHLPVREVGPQVGLAARRGPRRRLAPRRGRPRRPPRGHAADRAVPGAGQARPAAGPRPPDGRRGDHLGLRLLERRHGPVPRLLARACPSAARSASTSTRRSRTATTCTSASPRPARRRRRPSGRASPRGFRRPAGTPSRTARRGPTRRRTRRARRRTRPRGRRAPRSRGRRSSGRSRP